MARKKEPIYMDRWLLFHPYSTPAQSDFFVLTEKMRWIMLDYWLMHFQGNDLSELTRRPIKSSDHGDTGPIPGMIFFNPDSIFQGEGGNELLMENLDFMLRFWKRKGYYS